MKLSGKEVKAYLEYSTNLWFNQMKSENDHLLKIQSSDEGNVRLSSAFYNFSSAAGINYTIDLKGKKGDRVKITNFSNGEKFELDSQYTVAINSYRGNGGGGHLIKGSGIPKKQLAARIINSTDKDLRYFMIKWIENKKTITPEKYNNWQVIPENWWKKGKEKDMKLLFPG